MERFGRFWNRLELSILDYVTEDPEKKQNKLQSITGQKFESIKNPNPFGWMFNIATEDLRKSWNVKDKWIRYTDPVADRKYFLDNIILQEFQSQLKVFRVCLFKESQSPSTCRWCGNLFDNSKHIFWDCQYSQDFWEHFWFASGQWLEDSKKEKRDEFELNLLTYENLDLCSRAQSDHVRLNEHKNNICSLAKSYLLVCQEIGAFPLHSELECQLKAMRYSKFFHSHGYFWLHCPLPPPPGHPARIGINVNMDYQPSWRTCSEDSEVKMERRKIKYLKIFAIKYRYETGLLSVQ